MTDRTIPGMSPGQRIYYKLCRISPGLEQSQGKWETLTVSLRAIYDRIAADTPHMVPTMAEIHERDTETHNVRG